MGFEEELFHELATNTWDKRSRMQQEMVKGVKGEPFAVQELYRKGPLTPSQLASSMKTITEAGRERAERQRESMREAICWIFSQMGERRAREFVELTEEFTTYMSLCMPGKPRPTADEVKAAFSGNAQEDA